MLRARVNITTGGGEGTRLLSFEHQKQTGNSKSSREAERWLSRARREKSPKPGFLHKDLALPSSGALMCINHDNPRQLQCLGTASTY